MVKTSSWIQRVENSANALEGHDHPRYNACGFIVKPAIRPSTRKGALNTSEGEMMVNLWTLGSCQRSQLVLTLEKKTNMSFLEGGSPIFHILFFFEHRKSPLQMVRRHNFHALGIHNSSGLDFFWFIIVSHDVSTMSPLYPLVLGISPSPIDIPSGGQCSESFVIPRNTGWSIGFPNIECEIPGVLDRGIPKINIHPASWF